MTVENGFLERRVRSYAPRIAAAALIVVTLAATAGWLHTARELNRLVAYEPVGAEALRLARSAHADKARASKIDFDR